MATSQMELLTDLGLEGLTDNLKRAVFALREGKIILMLDAHERENEGDLIVAAEKITHSSMNFLIKQGSGVVCLALPKKRLDHLGLPLMIPDNTNFFQTAFTVSIEASFGVTTGVSAKDRAHTITVAMADDAQSSHLARPGHVFPLAARKNGVFDRMGHTEGSVDLMRIAGLKPGAVLCELMSEDGSMTMGDDRARFAAKFDIPVVSVEEVLFYRMQTEDVLTKSTKKISTRFGQLVWHNFRYLDSISVDVFHKPSWPNDRKLVTSLSLIDGDNLGKRFMAQIFEQSDDDPLVGALSSIRDGLSDLVFMTTTDEKTTARTSGEQALRVNAVICQALRELSVKEIKVNSINGELARIAHHYFAIKVI